MIPGNPLTLTAKPSPTKKPKKKKPKKPEPPPVLDFTLTTFNMLGSSHTAGGGKRPGMASGRVRAGRAAVLLNRHGTDVVGLPGDAGRPARGDAAADRRWTSTPASRCAGRDSENSIGWRRDLFVAVERHTVKIPYFNGGRAGDALRPAAATSTPASRRGSRTSTTRPTRRGSTASSASATGPRRSRSSLANRLIRTGIPVFITGDMNERDSYFCRMTAGAPMVAARGGTHNGGCQPGNPRAVDWIFGSQGVTFSSYYEDRSRLVDITTDHPVVSTAVRIVGESPDSDKRG